MSVKQTHTISLEKAKSEVNHWLDLKNYQQSKRDANAEQIEQIAEAVSDGVLSIQEDGVIIHKLTIPIKDDEGNVKYEELNYKARIDWSQIEPYMKGVKPQDTFGMINAHIAA